MDEKEVYKHFTEYLENATLTMADIHEYIRNNYKNTDFITKIGEINIGEYKLVLTPLLLRNMLSSFINDCIDRMDMACQMAGKFVEQRQKKREEFNKIVMKVDETIN